MRLRLILGVAVATLARGAGAQSTEGGPAPADLLRLMEDQRRLIEAQGRQIETLGHEIAELKRRLDGAPEPASVSLPAPAAAAGPAGALVAPQTASTKAPSASDDVDRVPEDAGKAVSVDEFPGAMPIPGTDARIKPGGWVRSTFVDRFDPMGSADRFTPSSIPAGDPGPEQVTGSTLSARPTRLSVDLRTSTGVGTMRAFVEADFEGTGNTIRLRHAYGHWRQVLIGQTWSTFGDLKAEPDAINEGGFGATVHLRQPVIRFTTPLGARTGLAFAVETPQQDVFGAQGQNAGLPDAFVALRFEQASDRRDRYALFRGGGHVQGALMLRRLGAQGADGEIVTAGGYGLNLTARMGIPGLRDRGWLLFGFVAGKGVGRYINDLAAAGGQDAIYDPVSGRLEPLPAFSSYLALEHWWATTLRSTFAAGLVRVDNLDWQPEDALHGTDQVSLNLAWSPIRRVDLIAEVLWGRRTNKNGARGQATQLQLGSTFRF